MNKQTLIVNLICFLESRSRQKTKMSVFPCQNIFFFSELQLETVATPAYLTLNYDLNNSLIQF